MHCTCPLANGVVFGCTKKYKIQYNLVTYTGPGESSGQRIAAIRVAECRKPLTCIYPQSVLRSLGSRPQRRRCLGQWDSLENRTGPTLGLKTAPAEG